MQCPKCQRTMELQEQYNDVIAICSCGNTKRVQPPPPTLREIFYYRAAVWSALRGGGGG